MALIRINETIYNLQRFTEIVLQFTEIVLWLDKAKPDQLWFSYDGKR